MYLNLKMALFEKGFSMEEVAKKIGLHRNTLANKINGKSKFYIDEIQALKSQFLPDMTLDFLSVKTA